MVLLENGYLRALVLGTAPGHGQGHEQGMQRRRRAGGEPAQRWEIREGFAPAGSMSSFCVPTISLQGSNGERGPPGSPGDRGPRGEPVTAFAGQLSASACKQGHVGSQGLQIDAQWLTPPACGPAGKLSAFTHQPGGDLPLSHSSHPFMLAASHQTAKIQRRPCPASQEQAERDQPPPHGCKTS